MKNTNTTNNATIDFSKMDSFDIFTDFDYKTVTNEDVAHIGDVLKTLRDDFVVTKADTTLFDVRPSHGEIIANIGSIVSTCKGVSVWFTVNDIGVRITDEYMQEFNNVDTCKMLLDIKSHKYIKKQHETRYTFNSIDNMLSFMSDLFNYYNASDTVEIENTESVAI